MPSVDSRYFGKHREVQSNWFFKVINTDLLGSADIIMEKCLNGNRNFVLIYVKSTQSLASNATKFNLELFVFERVLKVMNKLRL